MILGVCGGSGAGKSTFVQALVECALNCDVTVIQHDSYYADRSGLPLEERKSLNFDHPEALDTSLLVEHLRLLHGGIPVQVPVYDFHSHTRSGHVLVKPTRHFIIEGILIFYEDRLRDLMDLKVFIDVDDDVRLARRLHRDIVERGRSFETVMMQYINTVKIMHEKYVAPSMNYADLVIKDSRSERAISLIAAMFKQASETGV